MRLPAPPGVAAFAACLAFAAAGPPGAAQEPAALEPAADPVIAAAVAAVSAEEIESAVRRLVTFGTRHTFSATEDPARGIGAARRWIHERFSAIAAASGGRLQVSFETHNVPQGPRVPKEAEVVNVVATLPGTDPDRFVIVSGHYDSRNSSANDAAGDAPGADDDASGTAVALEAARVLAALKPRATVLFLAVAGEEQGLLGAAGHAKAAREKDHRIEAMLTNDIVGGVIGSSGRRENERVRLFSEGNISGPLNEQRRPAKSIVGSDNDAPSRQLARYLKARGEAAVPGFEVTLIFRQDRYLRGGDHKEFNDQGFAAVRFTEVHENYDRQHQDVRTEDGRGFGDLPDFLDWAFVRRVAQVNVAGLAELALAPASPRQVRVDISQLTPHTDLRWEANAEEDLAGYGILARRTHEPFWTKRFVVAKDRTSAHLENLSKDDWLFAVEAFDAAGHRSLPVYPTPARR